MIIKMVREWFIHIRLSHTIRRVLILLILRIQQVILFNHITLTQRKRQQQHQMAEIQICLILNECHQLQTEARLEAVEGRRDLTIISVNLFHKIVPPSIQPPHPPPITHNKIIITLSIMLPVETVKPNAPPLYPCTTLNYRT